MAVIVRGVIAEPNVGNGEWERGARTGSRVPSGRTRISAARGNGNRSGIRRRHLADDAERGRSAPANGSARAVRGLASSAGHRRPSTFSQLLALRPPLDGVLSNQREDRAEWGGWSLPAGACPGG